MNYDDIEGIAVVYGRKDIILEFLDQFFMDRQHDGVELKAVLLKDDMKKEVKWFVWKGD